MRTIKLIIADKDEKLGWNNTIGADTILRRTDVPDVYRVAKSRYTNKVGRLVHIKDWE